MVNLRATTITLIRHGRIDHPKLPTPRADEMRHYIKAYNSAPIAPPNAQIDVSSKHPPFDLMLTSTLPRSLDSARCLNFTNTKALSLFCEDDLPTFRTGPRLKFSPNIWLIAMRILWTLGRNYNCESRSAFDERMSRASQSLIDFQAQYTHIALMEHGLVNYTLSKKLKALGYRGIEQSTPHKHWGFIRLQRI